MRQEEKVSRGAGPEMIKLILRRLSILLHPFAKAYWFVVRPKTYGVKCIVRFGEEMLMIKNNYGNYKSWMFPGGGIKKGETPAQAAKREVKEEVGVEVEDLREIGVFRSAKEFKNDTVTVFVGRSKDKEINIESNEIADAKWLELNNLPEISEYSRLMIDMLRRQEV